MDRSSNKRKNYSKPRTYSLNVMEEQTLMVASGSTSTNITHARNVSVSAYELGAIEHITVE